MGVRRHLMAVALGALLAAPVVAHAKSPSSSTAHPSTAADTGTSKSGSSTSGHQQGGMVDLNSASAQQLDTLPGIGKKRAAAIIANRPYKTTDELVERKVVSQNVYDQIKDKIVAGRGAASGSSSSSKMKPNATKKPQ